jgi:phosphate transport system substrate-binding protein
LVAGFSTSYQSGNCCGCVTYLSPAQVTFAAERRENHSMIASRSKLFCLAVAALAAGACAKASSQDPAEQSSAGDRPQPTGDVIRMDGSSTVFPISQAVAEEFQETTRARVTIGVSGTGGGFKKFCRGEIVLSGASRPIKPSEVTQCKQTGVEFVELPVAYDGIAVVVHKDNSWVDFLTVAELKTMWAPASQGKVTRWNQIRPTWPNKDLHLFGPGVDSGTYDYFTKAVVGTEHASRGDFTASEDDNVLVQGVSTDPAALGFFSFAYYLENRDRLKLVPIDDGDSTNGAGPIRPDFETVAKGTYQPLSRPVFIYVNKAGLSRPEVSKFVEFYLTEGAALAKEVGYIPLLQEEIELTVQRLKNKVTGSMFERGSQVGVTIEQLLKGS